MQVSMAELEFLYRRYLALTMDKKEDSDVVLKQMKSVLFGQEVSFDAFLEGVTRWRRQSSMERIESNCIPFLNFKALFRILDLDKDSSITAVDLCTFLPHSVPKKGDRVRYHFTHFNPFPLESYLTIEVEY